MNIIETASRFLQGVKDSFGPREGECAICGTATLPAREDLGILISPETSFVPGQECVGNFEMEIWYVMDIKDSGQRARHAISSTGLDQVVECFQRQVEKDGVITALPDLSTIEPALAHYTGKTSVQ